MENVYHKKLDLFNANLVFINTTDALKEFVESHKMDYEEHFGDVKYLGLCTVLEGNNKSYYVICVFDGCLQTLVHECCHASFVILGDKGVPTDAGDANETFCYLTDHLFKLFQRYVTND